jgi:hypothetical protein
MFHPFEENVQELKDSELESRISELSRKYNSAARLGKSHLLTQIATFVTIYRDEVRRRALTAKLNNANDKDLDQLINVD